MLFNYSVGSQITKMSIGMYTIKSIIYNIVHGNKSSIWKSTRSHTNYILAKSLPIFCLFPETVKGHVLK